MVNEPLTTQQRILEAAKRVFHKKGLEGARMQEIADEAGINKALLHYYYRSKENLFDAVFMDAFQDLFTRLFKVICSDLSLEEKIREIINSYITMLQHNSYIPWFILNTMHSNPEKIAGFFTSAKISPADILEKLKESIKEEGLEDLDYRQLIINIISLSIFPLVGKPMIKIIFNLNEEKFEQFIETRKKELPEFIMNAIQRK